MSADPGTVDLGTPLPQGVDLDEFLRTLKRASDAVAPQQGTDQQSSYLQNTHQGNARQVPGYSVSNSVGNVEPPVGGSAPGEALAAATPTITVTGGTVEENATAGTVVATLGAVDPDAGESFTYTLASDPSGKFEVVGNEVRVKAGATLDYESATAHDITVTVTDAGGLSHTEVISIAVTNRNEAPTDITVTGGTVEENAAAGTVVATLGAVDPDAGESFTYALASDPSGKFEVVGNEVRVKAGATLDYESATAHDITVTVTDAGGLSHSETLTVAVTNQSGSIVGTAGNDVLNGTSEEDTISGLAGNDRLNGGAGNDLLDGGAGNDRMAGGIGNDTYIVDSTGDVVTEGSGQGTDTVQSSVSYTLGSNVENLTLTGSGNINATGNSLANTLTGNAGNNVLNGGSGNDTLIGGGGNDTLIGGTGDDLFVYMSGQGSDAISGGTGSWIDTIVLDPAGGPLQLGTDWTVNLTSGRIITQTESQLTFSNDADGTLTFADGSKIDFADIERVQW